MCSNVFIEVTSCFAGVVALSAIEGLSSRMGLIVLLEVISSYAGKAALFAYFFVILGKCKIFEQKLS